jgi:hypothetical protein
LPEPDPQPNEKSPAREKQKRDNEDIRAEEKGGVILRSVKIGEGCGKGEEKFLGSQGKREQKKQRPPFH